MGLVHSIYADVSLQLENARLALFQVLLEATQFCVQPSRNFFCRRIIFMKRMLDIPINQCIRDKARQLGSFRGNQNPKNACMPQARYGDVSLKHTDKDVTKIGARQIPWTAIL